MLCIQNKPYFYRLKVLRQQTGLEVKTWKKVYKDLGSMAAHSSFLNYTFSLDAVQFFFLFLFCFFAVEESNFKRKPMGHVYPQPPKKNSHMMLIGSSKNKQMNINHKNIKQNKKDSKHIDKLSLCSS